MKPERIKALIDLMAESDLSELTLSEEGAQLRLLREHGQLATASIAAPAVISRPASSKPQAQVSGYQAKAPLHGIVHFTPAPDQPPFIEVGAQVKAGQTLAVLEAMKMFHPLKAEADGVVEAILAASGTEVEAGQVLVRIA
ncbi:acetyl-CoA carboxylase biotin carboxyl carrier protein subunit [Pseudomonas sp. MM211]|uniref:acetyl-CoA carboxylase biotin carboxyl carrier protein n=1 Tax=Pseudomonas sp. MM211 TaxID=2866808 RepID=UPI001CEC8D67|nr:acetyl-CoA carboxylase biotin carboxyl carrier protein subunit [Pseudomonas sp. MM211]UCJ18490.1 acetyl-CoA carboxylase biotin carboxyl carrier protein subunit [Pseudomonas sp. MM211]